MPVRAEAKYVLFIFTNLLYDRVSDVVENGVSFASKILTHNRMH